MNGQNSSDSIISLNPSIFFLQEERKHGGVVIVRMQNIWDEINPLHSLYRSKLEESKAFAIIKVTINMTTEEIGLIVNEVESHTI